MRWKFQSTPPRRWRPMAHSLWTLRSQFQSTPPRRWRPEHPGGCVRNKQDFNPRHHAGGDTLWGWHNIDIKNFNPRHHAGGDVVWRRHKIKEGKFQSTPPRRWRLFDEKHEYVDVQFQSTPPRRWRRGPSGTRRNHPNISIHATTQVATWVEERRKNG